MIVRLDMKTLGKTEYWILLGLLILSFVPCFVGVLRLTELCGGTDILVKNPRVEAAPGPVVLHILTSVPYCLLGAFQFLPRFRSLYPMWHRRAGRSLVFFGIVSAVTGLWMTYFYSFTTDLQGSLLYLVRMIVGVAMISFILLGLLAVLKRRFSTHQAWMLRAYALGQGAGTQVIVSLPWIFISTELVGIARDIVMSFAWGLNILVAEYCIYRQRKV